MKIQKKGSCWQRPRFVPIQTTQQRERQKKKKTISKAETHKYTEFQPAIKKPINLQKDYQLIPKKSHTKIRSSHKPSKSSQTDSNPSHDTN